MSTPIPANHAELDVAAAVKATGGVIVRTTGRVARGIVSDTRAIHGGEAFVALRGVSHDGHDFVGKAASLGAALLVIDAPMDVPGGPDVVRVADTLAAWGDLARAHLAHWRNEDSRVIAITGSAGKTTTKQLCAALLRAAFSAESVWASPGNLNNRVGLPAVIFALDERHRFAVLEAGMSERGEIARLGAICEPDVAIITNVVTAHAEGVGGTRADVAREKGALFGAVRAGGSRVFNADDDFCADIARAYPDAIAFGRAEKARYQLVDRVVLGEAGSRVTITRPCEMCASPSAIETIELELPLLGEAAAIDLVGALAAAEAALGASIPRDALDRAMATVSNVGGRAELRRLGSDVIVLDDTYNANPASMRAALSALRDLARSGRRMVAVLGEMKELGAFSDAEHTSLGDAVHDAGVELVIGCGGHADLILARAAEHGLVALRGANVDAAAEALLDNIRPGDVVLVKASRSVGAEKVVVALERSLGAAS